MGDESALRAITLALRREKIKYSFAAVWWDETQLNQATFDIHDAAQQEVLKQQDTERKRKQAEALEDERRKNKENQKTEIERRLRESNGTKARGLMNYVQEMVNGMAEKRRVDNDELFSGYSDWLNKRFSDQWETFGLNSDVDDFGRVQWENRPL